VFQAATSLFKPHATLSKRLTWLMMILQSLGDMDGNNNWDCNHVRLQLNASSHTLTVMCIRLLISLEGRSQSYFKPRSGGIVTLYIDSHVEPNTTPVVKLPGMLVRSCDEQHCGRTNTDVLWSAAGGATFSQSSLWTDLYSAMREAKHVIYVAGWSVWVSNMLLRRQNGPMEEDEDHLELGTLLKRKVLIWCLLRMACLHSHSVKS